MEYRELLRSVGGVGKKTVDRIMSEYPTLDDLAVALLADETEMLGLAEETAEELREVVLRENGEPEATVRVRSLIGRPQRIFCHHEGQEEVYEIPERGTTKIPEHALEDSYIKDLIRANLIRIEGE